MAKDLEHMESDGWSEEGTWWVVAHSKEQTAMNVWSVLEIIWWQGTAPSPGHPWFEAFDREFARENNCQP